MSEEFKKDIIDGRIIDWDKLSDEELESIRKNLKQKEQELLRKINKELELDENIEL